VCRRIKLIEAMEGQKYQHYRERDGEMLQQHGKDVDLPPSSTQEHLPCQD